MGETTGEDAARQAWGSVRDNRERNRFELDVEGDAALAYYRIDNGVMVFTSTQTPPRLRGKGVASALIRDALEIARAHGLKVRGDCSFVADYLDRRPEFQDLRAERDAS
ncbi:MAG: GNAT family N-acetyltransferase [Methylocystis sp.]|uniref:GNAT family N-acetyltransferase n=1 Tax=Methylocystis sp. TaxID=1911079 RepID=UPI003D0E4E16